MTNFRKLATRLDLQQLHPVPLRVAASIVFNQLSRAPSLPTQGERYARALNDAAMALAQVADVYYRDARGRILRLPDEDLGAGRFEKRARVFRTTDGRAYENLCMRRGEMVDAILALRKARDAFSRAQRGGLAGTSSSQPRELTTRRMS
jgi:hypothetical protein